VYHTKSPPLEALSGSNPSESNLTHSVFEAVQRIFPEVKEQELARLKDEYETLRLELDRRYKKAGLLTFDGDPRLLALEDSSSFLVYLIVRIQMPNVLLETGVANGHSSFFLLNAILKNGQGYLTSTDTSQSVGSLLTDEEKSSWMLKVIDPTRTRESFIEVVESLPSIDFFIHDSDHSYLWSKFEYETVLKKMSPGSIMASDDVNYSYSFIDFTKKIVAKPIILVDKRKAFGVIHLK